MSPWLQMMWMSPSANISKLAIASLVEDARSVMSLKTVPKQIVLTKPASKDIRSTAGFSHRAGFANLGNFAPTSMPPLQAMVTSTSKSRPWKSELKSCAKLSKCLTMKYLSWKMSTIVKYVTTKLAQVPPWRHTLAKSTRISFNFRDKKEKWVLSLMMTPSTFQCLVAEDTSYQPLPAHCLQLWRKVSQCVSGATASLKLHQIVKWWSTWRQHTASPQTLSFLNPMLQLFVLKARTFVARSSFWIKPLHCTCTMNTRLGLTVTTVMPSFLAVMRCRKSIWSCAHFHAVATPSAFANDAHFVVDIYMCFCVLLR